MILSPKEADKKTNVFYFKPREPIHPEDYIQDQIEDDLRKSTHIVFIETREKVFNRCALSLMFRQAKKGGQQLRITRIRSMIDYAKLSLTLINKRLPVPIVVLGKPRDLCIYDSLFILENSLNRHLIFEDYDSEYHIIIADDAHEMSLERIFFSGYFFCSPTRVPYALSRILDNKDPREII